MILIHFKNYRLNKENTVEQVRYLKPGFSLVLRFLSLYVLKDGIFNLQEQQEDFFFFSFTSHIGYSFWINKLGSTVLVFLDRLSWVDFSKSISSRWFAIPFTLILSFPGTKLSLDAAGCKISNIRKKIVVHVQFIFNRPSVPHYLSNMDGNEWEKSVE